MISGLLYVALSLAGVGVCLWIGEQLRKKRYHPEITRKFIHISVATFAAFWPFYMSWTHIELISLLLFFGVVFARRYGYFKSAFSVKRSTWGELFFAMSIGFTALLSQDALIFTAAMLSLGIADGMAAVIGTLFGGGHQYKVFGSKKTRAGTITFLVAAFFIIWICGVLNGPHDTWTTAIWLPVLATIAENLGVQGLDNLFIPILVAISL
jgi:dolichol kinase